MKKILPLYACLIKGLFAARFEARFWRAKAEYLEDCLDEIEFGIAPAYTPTGILPDDPEEVAGGRDNRTPGDA